VHLVDFHYKNKKVTDIIKLTMHITPQHHTASSWIASHVANDQNSQTLSLLWVLYVSVSLPYI